MRMHSAAECRQVVHAFKSRGMEFREDRPNTARSTISRPATVGSQVATSQKGSPYFQAPQQPVSHPFKPQVVEAGSLSRHHPASHEHAFANTENAFQTTGRASQDMSPPKLLTRDETSVPRDVAPTRPSTAQIYRSNTIQASHAEFDANDIIHQAEKDGLARPSSTSNTAGADALNQAVEEYRSSPHATTNHTGWFDAESGHTNAEKNAEFGQMAARPSTASSFVFAETLEHEIPPRRELPFARPDSHKSGNSGPKARPRSALTLPPLPKPRMSPQNSSSSTVGNEAGALSPNRPQTSSPLKRPFTEMDEPTNQGNRPTTASPAKTVSSVQTASPHAHLKRAGPMEELLQARKLSLQKCSASRPKRIDSLADAPGEEDDSPQRNDRSSSKLPDRHDSVSPVRRTAPETDPTLNAYAAISDFRQQDGGLRQYAEQSPADRQAALEEFMMQNLESPAFTTLCKDVENCWRRIALGL